MSRMKFRCATAGLSSSAEANKASSGPWHRLDSRRKELAKADGALLDKPAVAHMTQVQQLTNHSSHFLASLMTTISPSSRPLTIETRS